jgi:hypothetical protein
MFLLESVCLFEGLELKEDIFKLVLDNSFGRPRNALVSLQQAVNIGLDNKNTIISAFTCVDENNVAIIDLCKALTYGKSTWAGVMSLYKDLDVEPEQIRITLAGWFRSILEKSTDFNNASKAANALSKLVGTLPSPKPENTLVLLLFQIYNIYK